MKHILILIFLLSLLCCIGCTTKKVEHLNQINRESTDKAAFQPNYLGDLHSVRYWSKSHITYRIIKKSQATDIMRNKISHIEPTEEEILSVREAFAKWEAALQIGADINPLMARHIVEVDENTKADIDVVFQKSLGDSTEVGTTNVWLSSVDRLEVGRAVIQVERIKTKILFRHTILHEIGHALFAGGHSRRVATTMYSYITDIMPQTDLSKYDINSIRAAYDR